MKNEIRIIFINLIVTICSIFLINSFFYQPKKIAVLDLNLIKDEYIKSISKLNLKEQEESNKQIIVKIDFLLKKIAEENNLLIITKPAVYRGSDFDITEDFRGALLND